MATFVRRKDSKCKNRITAMVRLRGLPRKTATFENMTKAKKWAQQMEVNLRDGRFFKKSESIKHTVNELVERFIEEKRSDHSNRSTTKLKCLVGGARS